ncbi:chemotaxis protein CheX [Cohnella luojiensis]|uniref:Chemotaxis protein CheX n=2 Tax=Cohnella luojiensis TaxID=652876 RepID=A0A4Y8LXN6_9BACL|nr:chemotaxis protein CheX [Cohnella luojiensis]
MLHSVMESVRQVIPIPAVVQSPNVLEDTVIQRDIEVFVGFTGHAYGRIVIQGECKTFSKLGEFMYGMPLEGDILHSFVGELANMVAGNTSILISNKGITIDITPPTVMVEKLHLHGYERGISVPVQFENVGEINIILLLQNQGDG